MTSFAGTGLQSVIFPRALKVVDQGAFFMCRKLREVAINEGLEILGTHEYNPNDDYFGVF